MGNFQCSAVSGYECKTTPNGGVFIGQTSNGVNPDKAFRENPFSLETPGNEVKFFTTGEEYFNEVAERIKAAKKSIFICGWQLDFDVMLNDKDRLFDCLHEALDSSQELRVYALPWASPKVPVNTHDLEALCALSLLNAGKEKDGSMRKMRVFVLPAIAQADQGLLTAGFSPHQKVVVIDNQVAYLGGLDLAYGRRDDNSFSLKWGWREGRERYNTCIPPIDQVKSTDERFYVTTMELVSSAAQEGDKLSQLSRKMQELKSKDHDKKDETEKEFKEWVDSSPKIKKVVEELQRISKEVDTVFYDFKESVKERAIDFAEQVLKRIFLKPPEFLVKFIAGGVEGTKIGNYHSKATIMLAFLFGQSLEDVPPQVWEEISEDFRILCRRLYTMCLYLSDVQETRYSYLTKKHQKDGKESYYYLLPPGGLYHATHQPRMPWQDVQCRVEGPTVFDLSMNFVRRWNGLQARLHAEDGARGTETVGKELMALIEFFLGVMDPHENRVKAKEDVRKMVEAVDKTIKQNRPKAEAIAKDVLEKTRQAQEQAQNEVAAAGRQLQADANRLVDGLVARKTLTQEQVDTFRSQLNSKLDEYKEKAKGAANSVVEAVESIKEDGRRLIVSIQKVPEPVFIPQDLLPVRTAGNGKFQLQVLRSASRRMLKDEDLGMDKGMQEAPELLASEKRRVPATYTAKDPKTGNDQVFPAYQDNCYEAICSAITNAVHFVYIEGQYFLSGHGEQDKVDLNVFSGPMGLMYDYRQLEGFNDWDNELGGTLSWMLAGNSPYLRKIDGAVLLRIQLKDPEFFKKLKKVILNRAAIYASNKIHRVSQERINNRFVEVLADRIQCAVYGGQNFHAYIVLPIYPEGNLGDFALMTMIHCTMQTLFNGRDSLVARIQRAIYAKRQVDAARAAGKKMGIPTAENLARKLDRQQLEDLVPPEDWMKYLTVLNLRNWDDLGKGPVTEQIYVHSKLVITDDLYAFLGSANINDRSLLGDRDVEIGLLIKDGTGFKAPITGGAPVTVSKAIHELRVRLWEKHFGLTGGSLGKISPASGLKDMLDKPADPKTWKAIQRVALRNLNQYTDAFYYIPRNNAGNNPDCQPIPEKDERPKEIKDKDPVKGKRGSSIWPIWHYHDVYSHLKGGEMKGWLPFEEAFWVDDEKRIEDAKEAEEEWQKLEMRPRPTPTSPRGIQGFIVAMPWLWTAGEYNDSGVNKLIIASFHQDDMAPFNNSSKPYHAEASQPGDNSKGNV